MARYWVYLNGGVMGPYGVEELIRLRGFSRQTQVCIEEESGSPQQWTTPAEIPELAHIFRAVDLHEAPTVPEPVAKPPAKAMPPRPMVRPSTPSLPVRSAAKVKPARREWLVPLGLVIAGVLMAGLWHWRRDARDSERETIKALIEQRQLPPSSLYGSLRQYLSDKELTPRWEFERSKEGLFQVSVSWYAPAGTSGAGPLTVYAFEVNLQAQSVRGLNSAAARLLAEGFPAPPAPKAKETPPPKKSPEKVFAEAVKGYCDALENGDFAAVWGSFSQRKRSEMSKAGISRDGYLRLQSLTFRVESAIKQTVLKVKAESDTERLLLLRQSQARRPDIFVKQLWIFEEGEWKLDDEQKRAVQNAASTSPPSSPSAPSTPPKPPVSKLPGMSN
jgi:hypothetical protein